MKKLLILTMLVMGSMAAFAQVTKEEQELIELSNQKWAGTLQHGLQAGRAVYVELENRRLD